MSNFKLNLINAFVFLDTIIALTNIIKIYKTNILNSLIMKYYQLSFKLNPRGFPHVVILLLMLTAFAG